MFLEGLRKNGDSRPWIWNPGENQLTVSSPDDKGASSVINLGTMYAEYCRSPRNQRSANLGKAIQGMLSQDFPESYEEARPHLLPVVKPNTERGYVEQTSKRGSPVRIAFRALAGNLEIGIAYDTEFGIHRLSEDRLEKWGITFDEALEAALNNLRDKSGQPFEQIAPNLRVSRFQDYYDASRLLIGDLIHRQVNSGNPVVMIPNRTVLLVTGDRSEDGLATMVAVAEKVLQAPRPLSPLMLRLCDGKWEVYEPVEVQERLSLLRKQSENADYESQKDLLQTACGEDVFVATHNLFRNQETGSVFSLCTWSESVPSLLPKTDRVVLYRPETKDQMIVAWDQLINVCSHLLKATDDLPVRYAVTEFPNDEELARLVAEG